jgi:hypothetical protein
MNPDTRTAPVFRVREDATISAKIYSFSSKGRRPAEWLSLKQNVFTSSNLDDLAEFARTAGVDEEVIPIARGSMIHQFDAFFSKFEAGEFATVPIAEKSRCQLRADKSVSREYYEKRMAAKAIRPKYHLAIRRIARATDERTLISAMLPEAGTDDTASLVLVSGPLEHECAVLANLNSLVLDYACSQKIGGTDIRKHSFLQLPIMSPDLYGQEDLAFVVSRVLELSYTNPRLAPFAAELGYAGVPFAWEEQRRASLRAELDAWYARAYRLTRDDLRYVLDPADVMGSEYPAETFRVLKNNEVKEFGESRTRRLVLEAWDRMEGGRASVAIRIMAHEQGSFVDLATLRDGAWAASSGNADAALAQLAALIKALSGPTPIARVRLAGLYALEPRYLTRRLSGLDRDVWRRLVGAAAEVSEGRNVAAFAPKINANWQSAVTQLRGMARLSKMLHRKRGHLARAFTNSIQRRGRMVERRSCFVFSIQ